MGAADALCHHARLRPPTHLVNTGVAKPGKHMKLTSTALLCLTATLLAGCAGSPHKYDGNPRPLDQVARVSVMGYPRQAGALIKTVDGQAADGGTVIYLLPGDHSFTVRIDMPSESGTGYRTATVNVKARLEAGRIYLPESIVADNKAMARMVDAGTDLPESCMPARIAQNAYQGAFASVHKDGSTCDRPLPPQKNVF
jgi:hypothetical protein